MIRDGWDTDTTTYPDDDNYGAQMGGFLDDLNITGGGGIVQEYIDKAKEAVDYQDLITDQKENLIKMAINAGLPEDKARSIVEKAGNNLEGAYANLKVEMTQKATGAVIGLVAGKTPPAQQPSYDLTKPPSFNFAPFGTGGTFTDAKGKTDYKKIGMYAGIGLGSIIGLVLITKGIKKAVK